MALVQKIDSNRTGLAYAEEASLGVLPGTPVWIPLEPNSYSDFGGEITTVARNPINAARQRKKGTTVDLDASGGLEQDLTQSNLQDLMQGFLFADFRRKTEFGGAGEVTNVDGTGEQYEASSGLTVFDVGNLIHASGFTNTANNGLKEVTVVAAAAIDVAENIVDETPPAAAKLVMVGHEFGTGLLDVVQPGSVFPKLVSAVAKASGSLTITASNAVNDETVTIGSRVYTWKTTLTGAANEVKIGTDEDVSRDNLIAAINAAAGAGTLYGTGTVAHANVAASSGGAGVVTVTAKAGGTGGNKYATTETMTNGSWGAATLTGGTGMSWTHLGVVPGEWIYIGGDLAAHKFTTAANNTYARVDTITEEATTSTATLGKTNSTMVAEADTTQTVRVFFGRVVKNESDDTLIKRRSYQIERSLGAPDDAQPTQIQAEYLVGAVPNQLDVKNTTAEKIMADLSFVAIDNEQRTSAQGKKAGTRTTLVSEDAFNTSNHVIRARMHSIDPLNSNPTALFGFMTDFTLTIQNNVTPNKAIGRLGAFEVTAGQFLVDGEATAYFSRVEAVQAVRNNEDVSMDFIVAKDNAGIAFDIPLIALGDARLDVAQDEPITLPLQMPAAESREFAQSHTLCVSFFDYLPTAAL